MLEEQGYATITAEHGKMSNGKQSAPRIGIEKGPLTGGGDKASSSSRLRLPDGDDRLLIIRRPVRRQRLQRWALEIKTLAVASIAAPDNLVDEASIGLERVEIARPVFSSCLPRSSAARISHDRIKVHVFGEPTNECFVGFNLAAHLQERASLHHQTDAVIRTSAVAELPSNARP